MRSLLKPHYMFLYCRSGVDGPRLVEETRIADASVLKASGKCITCRLGPYVYKVAPGRGWWNAIKGLAKHTFQRATHRRAWKAAVHLEEQCVDIPKLVAFAEKRWCGLTLGNVYVCEFLRDYVNVEVLAGEMVLNHAGEEAIRRFLRRLADHVNMLDQAGAYHADLSGKNIFTKDGAQFAFIDLDAVEIGVHVSDAMRMKNHIQLYDSFCDVIRPEQLGDFIRPMLPRGANAEEWIEAVRDGQAKRRARIMEIWKKEGKA